MFLIINYLSFIDFELVLYNYLWKLNLIIILNTKEGAIRYLP